MTFGGDRPVRYMVENPRFLNPTSDHIGDAHGGIRGGHVVLVLMRISLTN